MSALAWPSETDDPPLAPSPARTPLDLGAALWRGDQLGGAPVITRPSGFAALDAQLPGGGWPCRQVTELLQAQPGQWEWRLLGPALRSVTEAGAPVVLIGPPQRPHLPGLAHGGLGGRGLVWVQAQTPAERLWTAEQLLKANAAGALVAWLPQARPEQIRRLQVLAQHFAGLVWLCRPAAAQHEASAAPLRLLASVGLDWTLEVRVLKRRGPLHDGVLALDSVPGGLSPVLVPRVMRPSALFEARRRQQRQAVPAEGQSAVRSGATTLVTAQAQAKGNADVVGRAAATLAAAA
jgi:protein ImuA